MSTFDGIVHGAYRFTPHYQCIHGLISNHPIEFPSIQSIQPQSLLESIHVLNISVDYFRKNPERSPPLACFLSHVHSDHLQGLESFRAPFIYCSAATREVCIYFYPENP